MSDDLVYRLFVEPPVLEKTRDLGRIWLTTESKDLCRLLSKAISVGSGAAIERSVHAKQAGQPKATEPRSAKT
jgi:hypothetical protein